MNYKRIFDIVSQQVNSKAILRLDDNAFIPFDTANTDYAEFKKAVAEGAELQDADGNVMSAEAAQAFVATLP
jgi:hypothetical protein